MATPDVPYEHQMEAVSRVPDLVDEDDLVNVPVEVVAYALNFATTSVGVVIVTEEGPSLPTRASIPEACEELGIECISLTAFLARL
jgi:hypothetical protein